ncbi:hypothetical protein N8483_00025 [Synechococcus sp. AH-601-O20]|nr:hypothetical protein [Synechococcus sp. AH-601-O20]
MINSTKSLLFAEHLATWFRLGIGAVFAICPTQQRIKLLQGLFSGEGN